VTEIVPVPPPAADAREAMALLPADQPAQLLDEDGVLHDDPDLPIDDLTEDDLLALHRWMVLARRLDAQAVSLQRQGQVGVYASLHGQEAAQVGSAFALAPQDWVFPSYRELGSAIVRGVDPCGLMQQWRGVWLSGHDPRTSNVALACIPIGTQVVHATGLALAAALDGDDVVALACLGDGAMSEGDPHEAINIAAVKAAPVVFFVQNNQYAISTPLGAQTRAPTIAHKAIGYGMPGVRVDGNDVLATYAVTRRAVERARGGGGPTLVEAVTYRMGAHTTADDPTRYREPGERDRWEQRDPIARYETFLTRRGLLDDRSRSQVSDDAESLARDVRDATVDAPHGDPLELFDHVFTTPTPELLAQRALLRRELSDHPSSRRSS
jgi:2-oxoisovalerate dehydrogenase E1 component alpha subunit